jgi:hypothetical protein
MMMGISDLFKEKVSNIVLIQNTIKTSRAISHHSLQWSRAGKAFVNSEEVDSVKWG